MWPRAIRDAFSEILDPINCLKIGKYNKIVRKNQNHLPFWFPDDNRWRFFPHHFNLGWVLLVIIRALFTALTRGRGLACFLGSCELSTGVERPRNSMQHFWPLFCAFVAAVVRFNPALWNQRGDWSCLFAECCLP